MVCRLEWLCFGFVLARLVKIVWIELNSTHITLYIRVQISDLPRTLCFTLLLFLSQLSDPKSSRDNPVGFLQTPNVTST
jgi:hypothetical protein